MAPRPATSLVNAITLKLNKLSGTGGYGITVSKRSLQRWLKWAKSIDARFRKDGSKRSKRRAKR